MGERNIHEDVNKSSTIKTATALIEILETYLKNHVQTWNPDKIKWAPSQGAKGAYEKAEAQATPDFKALLSDLKVHDGKLTHNGYFYWIFTDAATIGRKLTKQ